MTDVSVNAVVFDLGGVLIDWNPRYLYRKIFDDEETVEWFLAEVCTRPWHEQQDRGGSSAVAVGTLSAQHPDYKTAIHAFYNRFDEMLGGPLHGTVDVLAALKDRSTPLFALSNWPADTFPNGDPPYEFLRWFDGLVVSGREKVMKPEPEIFHILCDRFALVPENTLFIDDVGENIAAAAALGFQTHLFDGAEQLWTALRQKGLLGPV